MQFKKNNAILKFPYSAARTIFVGLKLLKAYFYDFSRYFLKSSLLRVNGSVKILGRISANYHMLEKGLSMPQMKEGFGQKVVRDLIMLLKSAARNNLNGTTEFLGAIGALNQYLVQNERFIQTDLKEKLDNFLKEYEVSPELGGKQRKYKVELLKNWNINFHDFIRSRHSIRNYTPDQIDRNVIINCIESANYAPSVCNRQTSRVMVLTDKSMIKNALSYQNGNRGFGHLTGALAIVMSDLRLFHDLEERNQYAIDAGLFSMSLLLALQSEGLGACPLNWCVSIKTDKKFKEVFNIPSHYSIAMMISIGHIPDKLDVAISRRKSADEILLNLPVEQFDKKNQSFAE